MAIITKSFTITGNVSGLYELPELHLSGSVVSKSPDYKVTEVPPNKSSKTGRSYLMVKPSLEKGKTIEVEYNIGEVEPETHDSSVLNFILKTLEEVVETQDNLIKLLDGKINHDDMVKTISPIKQELKTLKSKVNLLSKK